MSTNGREHLRLQRELRDIQKERDGPVDAHIVDGNIFHWRGYIKGPIGTPYESGHFILTIKIPDDYPYNPPMIKFDTKIWHPNISSETGAICLDILNKEWSPALTIRTTLLSIQALLSAPEPDDPQDAEVAGMYKRSIDDFNQTARYSLFMRVYRNRLWTNTFAQDRSETREGKINMLVEMGFDVDAATYLSNVIMDDYLKVGSIQSNLEILQNKNAKLYDKSRAVAPFDTRQLYLSGYGRHWGEKLTYSVGLAYGSGILVGGTVGLAKGVAKGGATRKLRINSILNTCSVFGPGVANRTAAVTLLYCTLNNIIKFARNSPDNDPYNAPIAGLAAGAVYKITGPLKKSLAYSLSSGIIFSAIDLALKKGFI
ncbi:bifunctional Ubiquitin-conjugating enzyme-RWD-like/Ubiquitin-conjugating enzyme E2/Ubiquitin-conjugating enzyme [Babesia duncani]|uniref:Bifunctional Ubiquitin-conjugating enzyme-RWD-like/Ubiquitin-conjugating enzyme E2/Ubiquitin-conjugating enzyme n=1 Tax=Babesia duncani TaxID=323732 RepID=A0AAD9UNF7_9APIC|nr:bifunctional Ubiquitin-conjugating enzyme-RWD-like/Ubiquitin-conjugating enzyme E2/Ubiquitin-conjugating enzyme [Babesia duncani]